VTGGPPVLIYLYARTEDPRTMKATVQFVFLAMLVYRMVLIVCDPALRAVELWTLSAWACLPALGAVVVGHRWSRRSSPAVFRRVVSVIIAGLGVFIGAKTLWGLW
jgi:uncharacterized membrane protein YfcA